MANRSLIPNGLLQDAALRLMKKEGKSLERLPKKGTAKLFKTPEGKTVRIRTCNDPILVTVAKHAGKGAKLSIEGTDYILIVMPEIKRTYGPVIAFLVPTDIAVKDVREAHGKWLDGDPSTSGKNTTWNIWFGKGGPPASSGFFKKWNQYKLKSKAIVSPSAGHDSSSATQSGKLSLGEVIKQSKKQISKVAGVPASAIKIIVDLG